MSIIALPVLVLSAKSPLPVLPNARQLASVRSALADESDSTRNPSRHSDAVQLLIHAVAVPVPIVPRKTPMLLHSENRESCTTRLQAKAPLLSTNRPSDHF